MKTVLIRPSNPTGSVYLTKFGFLPVPIGLLQLAGCLLTLDNSQVKVIDMEADSTKSIESVVDETLRFDPDIVGLTIHATAAHNTSNIIAKMIKEQKRDTVLVAGGHHATFLPYDLLRDGFDIVVLGEGDETIVDIAKAIEQHMEFRNISGVVYRDVDGRFVRTIPRALIENLDRLPLPALDLVEKNRYTFKVFGKSDAVTCLETARGCPYACDFCSVTPTWGHKWRNKSVKRILMELEMARQYGYDWIFFTDDIFVVYPNVAQRMDLFESMIEQNFNFKWLVQMRADVTAKNPDLIKKGAEAGMRLAFLGIESGSPEMLKKMHKGLFTPQSVKAVRILSENGVLVLVGMMLGAPYEGLRDMLTTIRFSNKLADAGADAIQFSMYTPLPGTRVFDDALRNNKLFTLNWDRYDILTPVMRTKVHPVVTQMLQFYGNYSFYAIKYFKGRLRGERNTNAIKQDLVLNAEKFIFDMMPEYFRDMLKFPRTLWQTHKLYTSTAGRSTLPKERAAELMEASSRIIYLENGSKNPYFMIKEAE